MQQPRDLPVVLVLASGRGERFRASGGTVHKLQAPLAGKPVLAHTLDAVRASGLPWHVEDAGHPGMGDSIAAAVAATRGAPGWLVLPGDLPLIQPQTLREVAAALVEHGAVVPTFDGERGHPVGFDARFGDALRALTGDRGAAAIVRDAAAQGLVHRLAVRDIGCITDVDTVEALAEAERRFAARGPWPRVDNGG